MRNTFINTLVECARDDERIFLVTADLGFSVVERFAEEFPQRFLNVGIQEQNAVSLAAGLAMSGRVVYVYSIVPFVTMRCFEQVRVDVAYMQTNVRLVGVGAGLGYGPAGATHHSIEDISIMRSLPNMTVLCPGDPVEVAELVRASVGHRGPIYLRLGKGGEPIVHPPGLSIELGKVVPVLDGDELMIFTTSNMLETGHHLARMVREAGSRAGLVSVPTIKPLDCDGVRKLLDGKKAVCTLEEHSRIGGLGSAVAELIAESGIGVPFRRFGLPDEYCHVVGGAQYLREYYGLTPESLARQLLEEVLA